jgi:hypothetical protein
MQIGLWNAKMFFLEQNTGTYGTFIENSILKIFFALEETK